VQHFPSAKGRARPTLEESFGAAGGFETRPYETNLFGRERQPGETMLCDPGFSLSRDEAASMVR
jgi:hypothetical protein